MTMQLSVGKIALVVVLASGAARAQRVESLAPAVRAYATVTTPRAILTHVEVIDGTGGAPRPDQNVQIEGGKIAAIVPGADVAPRDGTTVLDLRGRAVIPGLVGMHEHLFIMVRPNLVADARFEAPALFHQMTFSAPRMYLAAGVTTMRTTGSVEPYTDLKLRRAIE